MIWPPKDVMLPVFEKKQIFSRYIYELKICGGVTMVRIISISP